MIREAIKAMVGEKFGRQPWDEKDCYFLINDHYAIYFGTDFLDIDYDKNLPHIWPRGSDVEIVARILYADPDLFRQIVEVVDGQKKNQTDY